MVGARVNLGLDLELDVFTGAGMGGQDCLGRGCHEAAAALDALSDVAGYGRALFTRLGGALGLPWGPQVALVLHGALVQGWADVG